jgi:hypothetical protein
MVKMPRLFTILAALAVALVTVACLALYTKPSLARQGLRAAFFGRPLLQVTSPARGQILSQSGVEVLVRFPRAERVAPGTFRCLLNGRDITRELTRGENGAAGAVLGAQEGENHLRVEVFGRGAWLDRFYEDAEEVTFRVRPLPFFDRA